MHRRIVICLFIFLMSTAWLSTARAAAEKPPRAAAKSSVGSPIGSISPTDYIRTDFTVENGLPNNVVNAIVETQNGLLWVGTDSGLASFDGRDFTPISLETEGSVPVGGVHSLLESSSGDLWVGADAGVVRLPRTSEGKS